MSYKVVAELIVQIRAHKISARYKKSWLSVEFNIEGACEAYSGSHLVARAFLWMCSSCKRLYKG